VNTISGRLAEARLYLYYVFAVLRPGIRVPTFSAPTEFSSSTDDFTDEDLMLLIDEGRRTLDQQETDLDRIRSRSATLLTLGLAEIAALSALAPHAFAHGPVVATLWGLGAAAIVLAIGGAAAVLTVQARMGYVDPQKVASVSAPLLPHLAQEYLRSLGDGATTVRTRLTVLRDAVLLETIAALLLGGIWPFIR
jgi:hypothetical protein